ncbi:hypothetical protein L345_17281, partial [Ophiophagus hannah]
MQRLGPGTEFSSWAHGLLVAANINDKASALDISASLKASFLGELVEVGGSAKYLHDTKKSKQQARVTVQYKATTKYEQLTMSHLGIQNVSYPAVFEHGTATHVVTAILYGAQAFFVFDREVSSMETEPFLLSLQDWLQGQFLPESAKTTRSSLGQEEDMAWFENKEWTRNACRAAKSIQDFFSLNQSNKNVRFVVASIPDVDNPGASIYLYEDGELVSKNFELPSKPPFPDW